MTSFPRRWYLFENRTIYHCVMFFRKCISMILTSSITNVQSLSSSSCVRGSLNSVTETVWLSGTAQLIIPFRGSLKHGSQSKGSELTLLLRLVQTTLSLFGFLEYYLFIYFFLLLQHVIRLLYKDYYKNTIFLLGMLKLIKLLYYI